MVVYIKTCGSAFNFMPVGCGEVPKLVLGGNNNFQGTFFAMSFFGPKTPTLNVSPRYSTITGFCPQNGLCTAGCGVVHHANGTWQSAVTQAQHASMQAPAQVQALLCSVQHGANLRKNTTSVTVAWRNALQAG
jgi:hypothetical protein